MSGTFVPMYGLNNMFGQIPIVGLFLGGGSNEGLIGVTYEVVGTPGAPVLRISRRAKVDEKTIEVSRSVFRADRYTLWVQFAHKP